MTLAYRCSNCGTWLQTTNAGPLHDQIDAMMAEIARLREALMLAQAWMLPAEVDSSGALKQAHATVREALGLAVDEHAAPLIAALSTLEDRPVQSAKSSRIVKPHEQRECHSTPDPDGT